MSKGIYLARYTDDQFRICATFFKPEEGWRSAIIVHDFLTREECTKIFVSYFSTETIEDNERLYSHPDLFWSKDYSPNKAMKVVYENEDEVFIPARLVYLKTRERDKGDQTVKSVSRYYETAEISEKTKQTEGYGDW